MEREQKRRFTWIDLEEIEKVFLKDPFPPRGHRGDLGDLRASISQLGMIHPILARVRSGKLQVICGYRRWLAAQVAGIEKIPVCIASLTDGEAERLYLEENRQWNSLPKISPPAVSMPPGSTARQFNAQFQAQPDLKNPERTVRDPHTVVFPAFTSRNKQEKLYENLGDHCIRCKTIFETIRRDRSIPASAVEELICRMREILRQPDPLDIRKVGIPEAQADPRMDGSQPQEEKAFDWLATHSIRVAILSQHFAMHLGWSEVAVAQLALAGLLHDVGMLFIPVNWFASPLPLTGNRYEALKSHTLIGRELIEQAKCWPQSIAVVAQDHHERWDGTGYPAGRKGREVSLPARLIGLLDSYAAMISKRSYRPPYLLSEAMQTLHEASRIGLFEPALERQFRDIFTLRPVGMRCRLSDGSLIQIQEIQPKRAKSHLLFVEESGSQFQQGEEIWYREKELLAQANEVGV